MRRIPLRQSCRRLVRDHQLPKRKRGQSQNGRSQAIFPLSSFIDMILEGTFNLVAVNARKFRNDLKIVCRRNDPLYEVIQSLLSTTLRSR